MILRGFNTIEVSPIERGVILTYGLDGVGRAAAKNDAGRCQYDAGTLTVRCRDTPLQLEVVACTQARRAGADRRFLFISKRVIPRR